MSEPAIRRAAEKDIPALFRLLEQVNRVHCEGRPDLFRPGTKYSPEELETLLQDEGRPVFVYEDAESGVQGYAFCIVQQLHSRLMTDIKTVYIDDLCVDEKARGRHIGQRLYEHVLAWAREIGSYNVTLNVWTLNAPAMRFYEKMGLKPQKIGMETIL